MAVNPVNPVNPPERLSDVMLAVFVTDLYEDQTEADARIHYNDIDNTFILNTAVAIAKLKAIDVIYLAGEYPVPVFTHRV